MTAQLVLPSELARTLADIDTLLPRTIVGSFAEELAPYGITAIIENRHTGEEKRWTSIHELVIETADGKLWRRLYDVGLTESQFQEPFEYEGPQVPFDEVKRITVEAFEYVPISSPTVEINIELTDRDKAAEFNAWRLRDLQGFNNWLQKQIRISGGRRPWV